MAYGIRIHYPGRVNSHGHDTVSFRPKIALHLISQITEIAVFKEAVKGHQGMAGERSPGLSP